MKPNAIDDNLTALDIARPVAADLDQAIGEATTVMGAMVTELMRRSLRGGVLKIGEQLEDFVGERVDLMIADRRPAIEEAAATVAEQTAFATAAKVAGEEVYALEQRTTEVTRTLAGQIEEADRRAQHSTTEVARELNGRLDEKTQRLAGAIEEGDQRAIEVTRTTARELTGQIEDSARRVSEATQAEIGSRVQELMDKAKEGAILLKARIKAVADTTADLARDLGTEREARQAEHAATRDDITKRLDRLALDLGRGFEDLRTRLTGEVGELRQENEKLGARVAELERSRWLHRLWAWLFGRRKR